MRLPVLGEGAGRTSAARWTSDLLLTRAILDHLLDLLLHCLEVEGSRVLHRRIVDRGQRQLLDELLDQDEAPELAREEVLAVPEGAGVRRFTANVRRALERILANVDDR